MAIPYDLPGLASVISPRLSDKHRIDQLVLERCYFAETVSIYMWSTVQRLDKDVKSGHSLATNVTTTYSELANSLGGGGLAITVLCRSRKPSQSPLTLPTGSPPNETLEGAVRRVPRFTLRTLAQVFSCVEFAI